MPIPFTTTTHTVCSSGSGTFQESDAPADSWSNVQPAPDQCHAARKKASVRQLSMSLGEGDLISKAADSDVLSLVKKSKHKKRSNSASQVMNPDHLSNVVDSLECMCRPCPKGYTSLGDKPEYAVCYPMLPADDSSNPYDRPQPFYQSFALAFSLLKTEEISDGQTKAKPEKTTKEAGEGHDGEEKRDAYLVPFATAIAYALEEVLPAAAHSQHGAVSGIQSIQLTSVTPLTDQGHFAVQYHLQGSRLAPNSLVDLINTAMSSPAEDSSSLCNSWQELLNFYLCATAADVTSAYKVKEIYASVDLETFLKAGPSSIFRQLQVQASTSPQFREVKYSQKYYNGFYRIWRAFSAILAHTRSTLARHWTSI